MLRGLRESLAALVVVAFVWVCKSSAAPSLHPIQIYARAEAVLNAQDGPYRRSVAKKMLKDLINRFPQSPFGYLGLSEIYLEEAVLGEGYHRMDIVREQALPLAIKALERGSSLKMVHEHYDRFMEIFQGVGMVQSQLEKDLRQHPYSPETIQRMGLFFMLQGDMQKAWEYFNTAWDDNRQFEVDLFESPRLMDALIENGLKTPREQSAFLRFMRSYPDRNLQLLWMGRVFEHFNDYETSEKLLTAYLENVPDDDYALYHYYKSRAYRLLKNGVNEDVWRLFGRLIKNPYAKLDDLRVYARLSFVLGYVKEAYQAYLEMEQTMGLSDPDLVFWIGRCAQILGRPHVAQTYFDHLMRVFHDSEQAHWLGEFPREGRVRHSLER